MKRLSPDPKQTSGCTQLSARYLFERRRIAGDQGARSRQRRVEVIDPEEQEEAIAGLGVLGASQRRVFVGAPLVKAEQNRSVRVDDLTEIVVGWRRLR